MSNRILFFAVTLSLFTIMFVSCTENTKKPIVPEVVEPKEIAPPDTISSVFSLASPKDTVANGEEIKHYKSGALYMRGMRKDSKRIGVWKSWYEDGTPWSETTFKEGKKNGKTTTWYENGKKRYDGFYANDTESGKWVYWDDKGNLIGTQDYGVK